ncbi:MAG: hypothetical protein JWM57_3901 [Phycisphaerales bacterium]|nr:hypothetical protein [Phycisphaerales bacterium]
MTQLLDAIDWLFRHTLRSVIFGIALMVSIAAYVAIGSGLPGVREYFELDELGFFNAWPLKALMTLMVANLVTVTLQRIPFTRPRYGVWMVHTGIITLIAGMGIYYGQKVEGTAFLIKGRTINRYYDRFERALYFQAAGSVTRVALPSLPRFNPYATEHGNESYLDRSDLKELSPIMSRSADGRIGTAADAVGAKALNFTVVGYWPYANLRDRIVEDAKQAKIGFAFSLPDADSGESHDRILAAGLPRYAKISWGTADIEHRELPDAGAVDKLVAGAKAAHMLTIKVADFEQKQAVQVGDTFQLGNTGYAIRVESFNPQWETIDKKIVPKLTFLVAAPKGLTYRRMVLGDGLGRPTDFKLGEAGAGPMGKRQKELLDPALSVDYAFDAEASLIPKNGLGRTLFVTTANSPKTTVLSVEANGPVTVQTIDGNAGHLDLAAPQQEDAMLMASVGRPTPRDTFHVDVKRSDHVGNVETYVEEVPKAIRNRDEGSSGRRQIVRVNYAGTDSEDKPFSGTVLVPFSERPFETPWQGGLINVPNASSVAQIQLANNWRPLPALARLDKLEAVAYAGMDPAAGSMIRDYRSTLTLTDPVTSKSRTDTVFLNSPVFYGNNNWIFFQASFDIQNQMWSVLGVGNRPGVYIMVTGCGLIIVGIFYAFYIKPVLVRRMKNQALAKAQQSGRLKPDLAPAGVN